MRSSWWGCCSLGGIAAAFLLDHPLAARLSTRWIPPSTPAAGTVEEQSKETSALKTLGRDLRGSLVWSSNREGQPRAVQRGPRHRPDRAPDQSSARGLPVAVLARRTADFVPAQPAAVGVVSRSGRLGPDDHERGRRQSAPPDRARLPPDVDTGRPIDHVHPGQQGDGHGRRLRRGTVGLRRR